MDDVSLCAAILGGDEASCRLLVERETSAVFRTCLRILGQPSDADDAAQSTMIIAIRSLATYRGDGPLGAWLAWIAVRESLRVLRAQATSTPIDDEFGVSDPDAGVDPPARLLAEERRAAVRAAVTGLPEPYRETVALRFFAELSIRQIASTTGRPEGSVKAHLHRGLDRLRVLLAIEVAA